MLEVLRVKYDGYRFSKNVMRIYNPFSLCIAFERKELGDYWFESGTPSFIFNLFEQKIFEISGMERNIKLNARYIDAYRLNYMNVVLLLFQPGYLTIKDYDKDLDIYVLGYPNNEVKYAFLECLMEIYTSVCRDVS